MIVINETDNRIYILYVRTSRRVQWRYAEYMGRWETPEKAVEIAKSRMSEPFEYRIEDMFDSHVVAHGFIE